MALTPSGVKRSVDLSGDTILTFRDPATGKEVQALLLVDGNGTIVGSVANPFVIAGTVTANNATPDDLRADVNLQVADVDVSGSNLVPVSGEFYQATQPVSALALPLPSGAALDDSVSLLKRMMKLLESLGVVDSAQRQRVTIDAGTLPTVTTVTTVASTTALGNVDARYLFIDTARNAYANGIRSKLSFS